MPSTTHYRRGDVLHVPFPFTDLTAAKQRPAVVLTSDRHNGSRDDVVLLVVTSQIPVPLAEDEFPIPASRSPVLLSAQGLDCPDHQSRHAESRPRHQADRGDARHIFEATSLGRSAGNPEPVSPRVNPGVPPGWKPGFTAARPPSLLHIVSVVSMPSTCEAALQDAGGGVAEGQARATLRFVGLEDGARLVEAREQAGKFVEVVAEEVWPAFLGDSFQHEAEVEQVPRERQFLGGVERDRRPSRRLPSTPALRKIERMRV